MRGETIKELEQKLDSKMDSALQNSHSVEQQDVQGMYDEWASYQPLTLQ